MTMKIYLFCLILLAGSRGVVSFTKLSHANSIQTSASNGGTSLFGIRSAVRRVRNSLLSRERTDKDLKDGIAFFYDRSSKLWEDVWGEHILFG